jgi:hypothetical protein
VGEPARFFKGLTEILNGQVARGINTMETLLRRWQDEGSRLRCLTCGYVMARVYALLMEKRPADSRQAGFAPCEQAGP